MKTLDKLSKGCWCTCGCIIILSRLNHCQNTQTGCAELRISFMDVVSFVPPSRLCQLFKLHVHLPIPLHALWYRFRDCAHHPAGFFIIAQLALLYLFIILIFPILPIFGTCKIAQTVSDSNHLSYNIPFRALWLSMPRSQLPSDLPPPAELLSLCLQLAILHQWCLTQHNARSGSLSLQCRSNALLDVPRAQASFRIASCAVPQVLGLFLPCSRSCLHSLEDDVMWTALSIQCICMPDVAKCSFLAHWPLLFVLTLLLGEMLDVEWYNQYGGKLRLLCQGWYV